jgi:hypothetical protein
MPRLRDSLYTKVKYSIVTYRNGITKKLE